MCVIAPWDQNGAKSSHMLHIVTGPLVGGTIEVRKAVFQEHLNLAGEEISARTGPKASKSASQLIIVE